MFNRKKITSFYSYDVICEIVDDLNRKQKQGQIVKSLFRRFKCKYKMTEYTHIALRLDFFFTFLFELI